MDENRRPIKTRSSAWAQALTRAFVKRDISPNQISVLSIGFALVGALALCVDQGIVASIICLLGIQLRLICNLLDGMVAIEGGKKSPVGALYNEFPDRIADSLLLIALGVATGFHSLGLFAALVAALTAYVRVFGGSLSLPQHFGGPMAKQHRMAVMSVALVLNMVEVIYLDTHHAIMAALIVILVGSIITCGTRTLKIAKQLETPHVDQ